MSSGMPVISTRLALITPMTAPTAIGPRINSRARMPPASWTVSPPLVTPKTAANSVMMRAMPMPMTPLVLPALAVSCLDRPANARMKNSPAMM
ncbi:MAG: hypothetical protein BWY91_03120 [bacterium ADurb.BinA028]|nr:MAG: hypothetical protein BWY91_03120 [bacterium ADurb.BinA028]